MTLQRRTFIIHSTVACGSLVAAQTALAQTTPAADLVKDTDAAALAVGYVTDATRANKVKYPTYAAGQRCGACVLYEASASEKSGPCPLFPNKQVAAGGWCSSWAKKV